MEPHLLAAPDNLTSWFEAERRPLPWRTTRGTPRDPWATLVSEIMSQQTRLDVVAPRLREWILRWPDPASLARATEEEVLAAWAGLGYYSRARNLLRSAQALSRNGWPITAAALQQLPGIGPYTAAAVASLAFGEQVAMVDGNILRVLARVHALEGDLHSGNRAKILAGLAEAWISQGDAGAINEATMELGALVCTPRSPRCDHCPLADLCRAAQSGEPERFPSRRTKRSRVDDSSRIAVVVRDKCVLLRRAGDNELLKGHWTLPEEGMLPPGFLLEPVEVGIVRHTITHHRILWTIVRAESRRAEAPAGMEWSPLRELGTRLVSSLPRKALAAAGIGIDATGIDSAL